MYKYQIYIYIYRISIVTVIDSYQDPKDFWLLSCAQGFRYFFGLGCQVIVLYIKISLHAGDQINFGGRYPHLKLCNITTKSDLEQKTFNTSTHQNLSLST